MSYSVQFTSIEEEIFFTDVYERVKIFVQKNSDTYFSRSSKVLVFMPVIPRARFLIHKCTEKFPKLLSISIGTETQRRVVIYFQVTKRSSLLNNYPPQSNHQAKTRNKAEIGLYDMSSSPRYKT